MSPGKQVNVQKPDDPDLVPFLMTDDGFSECGLLAELLPGFLGQGFWESYQ
jgi:hypothetical protein